MIAATRHDQFAFEDYRRLADLGIKTARDGIRWHLIEAEPNKFDLTSVERQMDAAADADVQVIWDIFHYGILITVDIFSKDFPSRFAALAHAFAEYYARRNNAPLFSFRSTRSRSFHLSRVIQAFLSICGRTRSRTQATACSCGRRSDRSVRRVIPHARPVMSEPRDLYHSTARRATPCFGLPEAYRTAQYEAFDMIVGTDRARAWRDARHLDIIGINYYPHNQWFYPDREMIPLGDELYRPFADMLQEIYGRYRRPMFIFGDGPEDERREGWFLYVAAQCAAAEDRGVDLNGICLYPIVNHPGWEDERHCRNGLWDYCDGKGERSIYEPLANRLRLSNRQDAVCASNSKPAKASLPVEGAAAVWV
jgi:hypothetical protein